MRFVRPSLLPLFCALLTAPLACGGSPADTSSSGGGGAGGGGTSAGGTGGSSGATGTPALHFFVDDRPHDASNEEIETDEARWGDPIRIVASGLAAGQQVRIDVSTESWGVFAADEGGTVDLAADAPLSGTWMTADIDGPFWSAPPADAPIFDVAVKVSDPDSAAILTEKSIYRRPVNDGVDSMKVNEGTRVGTLSRPPDTGVKRPAILAFGGSEGGTWAGEFMAYYFSQLGYVSFGVGYFGAPGLPATLQEVPIEILKDDLDFLASQPDVDPERIAVMGGSRGGELALLLGATFPDNVHAVIAQVPSGYVWGATSGADLSAWSFGGVDLPYVPASGAQPKIVQKLGKTYLYSTDVFLADIDAAPPDALAAARIPVENAKGPIFLNGGADDQLWPSCVLAQVAWDALVANGHTDTFADEMHCHPDAGHFITFPPGSSTMESTSYYNAQYDVYFVVGGTPEGIARAERQGNTALRAFLEKAFGQP